MSADLVKIGTGALVDTNNIEAQFALLKMFNLPPTMAETHRVERRDGKYVLCKRENPVAIFADDDGRMRAVVQVQKTIGERIGLSKTRGKYGDEGRLCDQDCASLAVGEVDAWGTV
jgi:hypothetical protein